MNGWSGADERVATDAVFVSYSHDDAEWMQAFQVMLSPVLDGRGVRLWVDTDTQTGDRWNTSIGQAITRSRVALLLVSPRFLFSDYVRRVELPALVRAGAVLAPVLVGSCGWSHVPELARVQWLHDQGREGALNLVADRPGERDRRIWQACERLLELLPAPAVGAAERDGLAAGAAVEVDDWGGSAAAIPAGSTVGALSGVPALPPGYVPRAELGELIAAVSDTPSGTVGVTGPGRIGLHGNGGMGKSVLAAALARDNHVRRRFPDGAFWVTVGQDDDVVAAQLDLLARLDPTIAAPPTPDALVAALRRALADRRALLVVDDVWSDATAHAFRLTGPRCRVVYTTRDPLVLAAAGAYAVAVPVLTEQGARAVANAVLHLDQTPGAVYPPLPVEADTALTMVGRVALAVTLLAAAVRGGRSWAKVAEELVPDSYGSHPYANTFKAMQVAVAALPDDLATALLSLAVFPPNARTPTAAVVRFWERTRGYTRAQTDAVLARLADAKLLTLHRGGTDTDAAEVEFHDL